MADESFRSGLQAGQAFSAGLQDGVNLANARQQLEIRKEQLAIQKQQIAQTAGNRFFQKMQFGLSKVPMKSRGTFLKSVLVPEAQQMGIPVDVAGLETIFKDEELSLGALNQVSSLLQKNDPNAMSAALQAGLSYEQMIELAKQGASNQAKQAELQQRFAFREEEQQQRREDRQTLQAARQQDNYFKAKESLQKNTTTILQQARGDLESLDNAERLLKEAIATNNNQAFNIAVTQMQKAAQGGRVSDADYRLFVVNPGVKGLRDRIQNLSGQFSKETARNALKIAQTFKARKEKSFQQLHGNLSARAKTLSQRFNGFESPEQISQDLGIGELTGAPSASQGASGNKPAGAQPSGGASPTSPQNFGDDVIAKLAERTQQLLNTGQVTIETVKAELEQKGLSPEQIQQVLGGQ